jgi:hypothetical protein
LRLKYGHDQALNALLQFYILFEELNLLALHQGIHANLYKYSSSTWDEERILRGKVFGQEAIMFQQSEEMKKRYEIISSIRKVKISE